MMKYIYIILLITLIPKAIFDLPVHASDVAIPDANAPANHIEYQQQAELCAAHAQNIIESLSSSDPKDDGAFRQQVIAAISALSNCRQKDVQALKHRNNAQVGFSPSEAEL